MQASYIITYRADDAGYRRHNLETVLTWLSTLALRDELQVILVEQAATPSLNAAEDPLLERVELLHVYSEQAFNKSWGFNIGARLARTPWLIFADADMILPGGLDETLDVLARGVDVVKPYSRMIDLDAAQTEALDEGVLPQAALSGEQASGRAHIGEHVVLAGGVFAIQAARFGQIGGFDERFLGWGGEDDAMTLKIQRTRPSVVALDAPALHLYHPRDQAALMNHPQYAQNKALLSCYRDLPESPLFRMFEIQKQFAGNIHKYSPASSHAGLGARR